MNYGKIKITGTSSELKRRIGGGFKLAIILKENRPADKTDIINLVQKHCSSSSLIESSGGALLFVIPVGCSKEIRQLLKAYESDEDIFGIVDDLSVSNSSLEEVFIEVTRDVDEDEDDGIVGGDDEGSGYQFDLDTSDIF